MTPFVLSDMDGVLVDSMDAAARAWGAWGATLGIDGAAVQAANHGRPAREVIAAVAPPERVDEGVRLVREGEIALAAEGRPLPDAAAVLALPRVAVVTSCETPLALARLRGAGLRVPDVLVTVDQVERGKPAPDPYLLAAARLGADPADCIVIEDAPAGIAAGRAAGMTVWAVTTTHPAAELTAADRVAAALPDLLRTLPAPSRRAG